MRLVVCVVMLLSAVRVFADAEFATLLKPTLENLLKDKRLAEWKDKVLWDQIKHGLDRRVAEIIAKDKFVKENRDVIDSMMRDIGEFGRAELRSSATEATFKEGDVPGQYQGILSAAQKIAKAFNFSKEMRSNLNAFVMNSNVVNAYSYGSADGIDISLNTAIIELLNEADAPINKVDKMLKSVIAHEIAHTKNKHVENRLIIFLVFILKFRNIIPYSEHANLSATMKEHVMQTIFRISPNEAQAQPHLLEIVDRAWDTIERTTDRLELMVEENPERFEKLTEKIDRAFDSYDMRDILLDKAKTKTETETETEKKENSTTEKIETNSNINLFNRKLVKFLNDLLKLSRSHEITCDRFAQIATSKEAIQDTFTRMSGGRGANRHAMLKQAERWAAHLIENPKVREINKESTHPVKLMRIYQAALFAESFPMKTIQSPMHKALTLYINALNVLEKSEKALNNNSNNNNENKEVYENYDMSNGKNKDKNKNHDSKETYELYIETEKATPFKKLVAELSKTIADSIIPENSTAESEINTSRFAELVEHLQYLRAKKGRESVPSKSLTVPGTAEKIEGLLYTLNYRLRNLESGGKLSEHAVNLLKPFQPFNTVWRLDRDSGQWIQESKTFNDRERRSLEDFRKITEKATESKIASTKASRTAKKRR